MPFPYSGMFRKTGKETKIISGAKFANQSTKMGLEVSNKGAWFAVLCDGNCLDMECLR